MPEWTSDQLDAINTKDTGVIVSAAAGSGKTAVLVERTIRMLCDEQARIEADRLLAVTFTNDAAAQMRQKLSDALSERIKANPESEWLISQQSKLALAQVTTINSFCYNFVRDHIHEFDFDGSVAICDENDDLAILSEALDSAVEFFYETRADDMEFLNGAICSSGDKEIFDAVKELHRFFESIPFKEEWINTQRQRYSSNEFFKGIFEKTKTELFDKLKFLIDILTGIAKKAERIESSTAPFKIINGDIEGLKAICQSIDNSEIDKINLDLSEFKFAHFAGVKKDASPADIALCESVKTARDSVKKQFKALPKMITADQNDLENDRAFCSRIFDIITDLEQELCRRVHEIKVIRNTVSFSDVEHMAVELLLCDKNTRTPLCEEIVKNRDYRVILIDEFQDVNNLQDLIFKAISDTDDLSHIGSNMFVVGDMKQSIYSFRLSNPKLFDNVRKSAEVTPDSVKKITLKKNFRSRLSVIDSVNYFFTSLMTKDTGEIDYTDESERLVAGAAFDAEGNAPVEVDIICEGEKLLPYFGFDNEQLSVANRIAELIAEGVTVTDGKASRPCRAGDFCILTRGRSVHKGIAKALEFVGLKCSVESSEGYLKSREIAVILNLLKVIDNPMSDIALLSVMMSPIMMFTADETAAIRSLNFKNKLFINLISFNRLEEKSPALCEKAKRAYELLKELRFLSAGLTTEKLIRKIYDKTGYYAAAAAYLDSSKRDNLMLLLRYAKKFDDSSGKGLSGFLRYINSVFENGGDFKLSEKKVSSPNAVTVTTMHASKGLEYPFVFLCDADKRMNLRDAAGTVIINENLGISFVYKDLDKHIKCVPQHYTVLRDNCINESIAEEIRILYVAMTRAKERIFLPVYLNERNLAKLKSLASDLVNTGYISSEAVKATDGMFRWIVLPLLEHRDMTSLRGLSEADFSDHELKGKKGLFCEQIINPGKTPLKVSISDFFNDEVTKQENINLDFRYDRRLCDTPAKLSVSEVVKEDKDFVFYPQIPKFSEVIGKYTAAERGTIAHSFMELCDFENAGRSISGELDRLVSLGKMSRRRADSIDIEAVQGFFESDIFRRLSDSQNIMREKAFLVKIVDIRAKGVDLSGYADTDGMLQGIADCIFEEPDGYVLIDYKTDRVLSEQDLKENYTAQLALYKAAFDKILDKSVKSAYIYSFVLKKGIEINV